MDGSYLTNPEPGNGGNHSNSRDAKEEKRTASTGEAEAENREPKQTTGRPDTLTSYTYTYRGEIRIKRI